MLVRRTPHGPRRRRGATVVESALVLAVFLALLFGLFEYCRFLLVLHVANNAARDGARYATVNVTRPATFDADPHTDPAGTTHPSVRAYTTARMGGVDRQLVGYRVAVYPCDPVGLGQSPAVVRAKSANPPSYPDPFDPADPNRTAWNAASFTERIAVHIKGTYRPVVPLSVSTPWFTIALVPDNIPLDVIAMMGSEG